LRVFGIPRLGVIVLADLTAWCGASMYSVGARHVSSRSLDQTPS
jgi:hypothetical protein